MDYRIIDNHGHYEVYIDGNFTVRQIQLQKQYTKQ